MQIRPATKDDVHAIARLALIASELYQRLVYTILDSRPIVPHECHPYDGQIILLTRPVAP